MPYTKPPVGVAQIETVATAGGKASVIDGDHADRWPKARLFVLADRTAVLVHFTDWPSSSELTRRTFTVLESSWSRSGRQLTVVTDDGLIVVLEGSGCGCGLGAVGSAGPTAERYRLVKVRAPDWHTVS